MGCFKCALMSFNLWPWKVLTLLVGKKYMWKATVGHRGEDRKDLGNLTEDILRLRSATKVMRVLFD